MRENRPWRLFLMMLCLHVTMTAGAQPINLNLKSGLLSRLLGDSSNSNERFDSSSSTAASSRESLKGKVSLDLSGKYHCLVAGPQEQRKTQGTLIPLFGLGTTTKGWTPPSLILSIEYNFSRAWYGATRLLTDIQWSYRSDELETEPSESPFTINVKTEKDLEKPGEYAAEVGASWKALNRNPVHLAVRWEPSCGQVSASAPLHKRLELAWRCILLRNKPTTGYFASRFPSPSDDWWIPNLMINTGGRLTSKNEVALAFDKKRRIGVRLMVRRQLGWSAFGGAIVDDPDTLVRLEVRGMDDGAESFSTATMETVLERVRESTRWTLSHEQVHIL
jgi:hypothetical protein